MGDWIDEDGRPATFYKDGSCDLQGLDKAKYYEVSENGALTFMDEYHNEFTDGSYYYKIEGDKLYISKLGTGTEILTRK